MKAEIEASEGTMLNGQVEPSNRGAAGSVAGAGVQRNGNSQNAPSAGSQQQQQQQLRSQDDAMVGYVVWLRYYCGLE